MGKNKEKNKVCSPEFKINVIVDIREHYLSCNKMVCKYREGAELNKTALTVGMHILERISGSFSESRGVKTFLCVKACLCGTFSSLAVSIAMVYFTFCRRHLSAVIFSKDTEIISAVARYLKAHASDCSDKITVDTKVSTVILSLHHLGAAYDQGFIDRWSCHLPFLGVT